MGQEEIGTGHGCGMHENPTCLAPTPSCPYHFFALKCLEGYNHGRLTLREKANCKQSIFSTGNIQSIKIMPVFVIVLLVADFHHYRNHNKCKVSKRVASRKAKGCK